MHIANRVKCENKNNTQLTTFNFLTASKIDDMGCFVSYNMYFGQRYLLSIRTLRIAYL